ncbi:hypothetical protein CDV31_015606 [Fusarium ambrosium]|uniref:Zn(2)-C6 fungal-type domain-containing protein n=1 Tax=Fusarium ambrosium TaxID=131363 RepID=A0A428SM66_9HYPO|nr:hypothetical protein CDV31_015606 [Fusarium ambrosium]
MVSKAWRVRFAPSSQVVPSIHRPPKDDSPVIRRQPKSKSACRECRLRRAKCDEAYPVCQHCARRGTVCTPAPRKTMWKLEMPLLIQQAACCRDGTTPSVLLQYYFEQVCHIMVLDPDINPLALPILDLFRESSALLHVVQSIAAAHMNGFRDANTSDCLVERGQTLLCIQQELLQTRKKAIATFLAIFLLGISSPWIEGTTGLEHLVGARALIDSILSDPTSDPSDPAIQLIVGNYIWWEMAASFNLDHRFHKSLSVEFISEAVQASQREYHPMAGYSLGMFYAVAKVTHYCRGVVDRQSRDLALEASLEDEMLAWTPSQEDELLFLLIDAYRKHGLIQLYRICGRDLEQDNEVMIQQWASEAMEGLLRIPPSSPYLNFQPIPLMSAASEIPAHKLQQREEVKLRFKAIYSLTRLPVMLEAINLLEEIWERRSLGITTTWLVILLERGQVFPLA